MTIICGDLQKIDERVSDLLNLSASTHEDITLVTHPAACARASEQIIFFEKILSEVVADTAATHFIIATNAAAIVSRVGEMIETNDLSRDQIRVELVDVTEHRVCQFDEQGILTDWPIGYLS